MEKEHFEILLEHMNANTQAALEGFDGVNLRLDRLESGQHELKLDFREMKRVFGLIHSIANHHETRLQNVEAALSEHLKSNS